MKTSILTRLLADKPTPALLLEESEPQWSNDAFAQLPKKQRKAIIDWSKNSSAAPLNSNGAIFLPLSAGERQLLLACGHHGAAQQRTLLQELLPPLAAGGDPFFLMPQRLPPLLGWPEAVGCKLQGADKLTSIGRCAGEQLLPPQTLPLENSLAAPLYQPGHPGTLILEWDRKEAAVADPLLGDRGIWIAQRVDDRDGTPLGHLSLWGEVKKVDLADSVHLLRLCADLISAWQPARAEDAAPAPHAQLDPLTQLPGREALDITLTRSEQEQKQSGRDFLLALIDIDNLSAINSVRGQQEGDRVLCQFADRLRHICRPDDRLFRFGGDEFVLVLPIKHDPPPLQQRLQQINRAMAQMLGSNFHASAGLARLSEVNGSGDELLLLADSRMRKEKEQYNSGLATY
jgi:diguanylate cyclase (GGDEF)-like protein